MKVYAIKGSTYSCADRMARRCEEGFPSRMVDSREKRFRYADLLIYGLSESDIHGMLSRGSLKEVEVDRRTAISIAVYHKCRTDTNYKDALIESLKKSRAKVDQHARAMAVAAARKKTYATRRRLLLKKVIVPGFYVDGAPPADGISIQDVVDTVEDHPDILDRYPAGIYHAVMNDMRHLGIETADASPRLKKTWEMKMKRDPAFVAKLRRRILHATEERRRIYEKDPAKAADNYAASAYTRREKMQTDPDFRSMVLGNLALGAGALYRRCREDPVFGEEVFKARRSSLAKGLRTIKKRAESRRHELKSIIVERFGNVHDESVREITEYLVSEKPDFVEHYYRGNPYFTVKKDVAKLRDDDS